MNRNIVIAALVAVLLGLGSLYAVTIGRPLDDQKIDTSTFDTIASQITSGNACRARAVAQVLTGSVDQWTKAVNEIVKANQKQAQLDPKTPTLTLSDRTFSMGDAEHPLRGIGVAGKVGGRRGSGFGGIFLFRRKAVQGGMHRHGIGQTVNVLAELCCHILCTAN